MLYFIILNYKGIIDANNSRYKKYINNKVCEKKNEGDVIIVIECIVFRRKGYNKGNNEDMNNYKLTVLFVNNLIQILKCYT